MTNNQLKSIICQVLESSKLPAGHHSLVKKAKELYNKCNINEWNDNFLNAFKYCLVYDEKSSVDQMMRFVAKFASSLYSQKVDNDDSDEIDETEVHPFIGALFCFLFKIHSASHVDARLRCITLINYILSSLPEDSWLPVSIWNGLAETIRTRLQDRNTGVRVAAVLVARKLQEPKDPKCEIVKLLTFHLTDPAPAVRRAVVSSIALSKLTIVDVLGRTLDVNENVRRNAYAVIAKVRFQSLTISQRILIIERGTKDRADNVRKCLGTVVLPQWFDHVNCNLIKLLEGLDVVNCHQVALSGLSALKNTITIDDMLKHLPVDETIRLIPSEVLTPELALLWRFIVSEAKENNNLSVLELVLPNVSKFVEFTESWYQNTLNVPSIRTNDEQWIDVQRKRVLTHLLEICMLLDLSDEVGRENLRKMSIKMLKSDGIGCVLIPNLVDIVHRVTADDNSFLRTVLEAISDIREPLCEVIVKQSESQKIATEVEISKLKLALYNLRDEEENAVKCKNYTEAERIASKINELVGALEDLQGRPLPEVMLTENREERTDPETVCKCLKLLIKVLEASGMKRLTPELHSLTEFITRGLQSNDLLTQSLSVQALGEFCILDMEVAQRYLCGFIYMLSEDGPPEINIPALKSVFDIFHIHGTNFLKGEFSNSAGLNQSEDSNAAEDTSNMYDDDLPSQPAKGMANAPTAKCLTVLKMLLYSTENDEMKRTVFVGFCKLLATGIIYSPSLLKTVIIKGFSPIQGSESEDRIRQFFMVFFPIFARHTSRSQEMIEAAFIPVMRALKQAQLGTAEADTNVRDVSTFLIEYTKPDINSNSSGTVCVHNNLALSLCHEILRDLAAVPDSDADHNYLKSLLQLNLCLDSESYINQLLTLVTKVKREVREASGLRMIKQLLAKIIGASAVSVQNTLESTHQSTMRSSALQNNSTKVALNDVAEEEENYSIISCSTSSDRKSVVPAVTVIPESPDLFE